VSGQTLALDVDNGVTVRCPGGRTGFVGSAHYSGPIDGTGTVTLCFTDGTEWSGPAWMPMVVLS
jgi:hypothetical protein